MLKFKNSSHNSYVKWQRTVLISSNHHLSYAVSLTERQELGIILAVESLLARVQEALFAIVKTVK